MTSKEPAEKVVRDIRRRTRRRYSSEEKIPIVLEGLRGEESMGGLRHDRLDHGCAEVSSRAISTTRSAIYA